MPGNFSEIRLGIVCPMASEEDNAVAFVEAVLAVCGSRDFQSVVMFVVLDRASKDRTREILEAYALHESRLSVIWAPENTCVVDAYVRGYRETLAAGSDWILEIDAGFSHRPADIAQFFDKMAGRYDAVFGSRFMRGGRMVNTNWKKIIISQGGTMLANLVLGTKLHDMTSGFELFSRSTLERILDKGIQSRGPFFQTEIKFYCRDLRTVEVPIQYESETQPAGKGALKDALDNLWRLRKTSPLVKT